MTLLSSRDGLSVHSIWVQSVYSTSPDSRSSGMGYHDAPAPSVHGELTPYSSVASNTLSPAFLYVSLTVTLVGDFAIRPTRSASVRYIAPKVTPPPEMSLL